MIEFLASFFSGGGPFMWLILIIFAAALAVIVERLIFFLHTCRQHSDELVTKVAAALGRGDWARARAVAGAKDAPLNAIILATVAGASAGLGPVELRRNVEETAIRELPRLSRRLNYLALFANVATLAGLLGTIFGLQRSFSSLAVVEAAQKASLLASGISQAMNTTAFGLIVAIPCLMAFTKLSNMQADLTEDLDASATRLLNHLETGRTQECMRLEHGNLETVPAPKALDQQEGRQSAS